MLHQTNELFHHAYFHYRGRDCLFLWFVTDPYSKHRNRTTQNVKCTSPFCFIPSPVILPSRCTHLSSRIWLASCHCHNIQQLKLFRRKNNKIKKLQLKHVIKSGIGNDNWNHLKKLSTTNSIASSVANKHTGKRTIYFYN